jgi:alpha-mannosidase
VDRQRYPEYTRGRIAQTVGRLEALVYPARQTTDELLISPRTGRISHNEAKDLEYRPASMGQRLGPFWSTYWFRARATVPDAWAGARVDLIWRTGGETTLWRDGRPAQALVSGIGRSREVAPLLAAARGGEVLEIELEQACQGHNDEPAPGLTEAEPIRLDGCEIARFDPQASKLYHDLRVLHELEADAAAGLDPSWAGELLAELNRFCNVWDEDDRATWAEAGAILDGLLSRRNGTRVHELLAIGHGHIDTAWLWPLAEAFRKCQRTFSTQLALMELYPEHRFAAPAAQHYAWLRDRDPKLYAAVREQVREGRFVPVGGTWVEPDCNLPAGESLVRQFLHGQAFFASELGARCTEFWNPDVFGLGNQIPQIMRGAGITRFLTQKLSWSRFTQLPSHTFEWEGLDGTRVLAHFPPAATYNSPATVAELRRSVREYRDHDRSRHSALVFGHGDGGGGPTSEMLETLRRARDLQGLPRTTLVTSEELFEALERDADGLPVVVGELYLEFHRGVYTSQAAIKRANRRCEALLHDAEFLCSAALAIADRPYPQEALAELWRVLLVNQFHDILPGSSIPEVCAEAREQLAGVEREADALAATAAAALLPDGELVPVNTVGVARAEVVERPDGALAFAEAPSYGWGRCVAAPGEVALEEHAGGYRLSNGILDVDLARDGTVASLRLADGGREALSAPGNRLELYEDRPLDFDAWDVDPFHLETGRPCDGALERAVAVADPLRAEVAFEHAIGASSRLVQHVRLDAGARRLEFHTEIDWRERHRMLKVAFPVGVRAERATYEGAFGYAERPTHFTTAADLARFEVPGHRWSDLSEHGFGVALLNDSKYGHSTHDGVLRISLLRAPTWPDPEADQGVHRFAYAVLPHAGDWRDAGVVGEARCFGSPLRWGRGDAVLRSLARVEDANLVLDTIKRSEDGAALVARLYEAHGARGVAELELGLPFSRAWRANLLEDEGEEVEVDGRAIRVPYRPHEIITLLVR